MERPVTRDHWPQSSPALRPSQATSQTPQTLISGFQGPHAYTGGWEVSSCEPT